MASTLSVMDISAANGHLVLMDGSTPFFDFGHIGGGTWFRVNNMWRQLQHGPRTRIDLCGKYDDQLGFNWIKDLKLILQADRLHQARKFSLWKLNFDRTLYRRNAVLIGMKLVSHNTPIVPYNDPTYSK